MIFKENSFEEFECGICDKSRKKSPEEKIGKLETKEDFEKVFDISNNPWYEDGLTRWELKSIEKINLIIDSDITKKGMTILDIGVATGEKDYEIFKRFDSSNKFYFIDISSKAIAKAKKIMPFGEFLQRDINQGVSFKNNAFDMIFCLEIIYYLNLKKVIKEFKRLIKPGGYILFDMSLRNDSYEYNPKQLFQLLKDNGFNLKNFEGTLCPKCNRKRVFLLFEEKIK